MKEALISGLFALVGGAAGAVIAIAFSGHVEAQRLQAERRSEAIAAYLDHAWAPDSPDNQVEHQLALTRALNTLTVYAPAEVLRAVLEYQATNCAADYDSTPACRRLWSAVGVQLRAFSGSDPVAPTLVCETVFGAGEC